MIIIRLCTKCPIGRACPFRSVRWRGGKLSRNRCCRPRIFHHRKEPIFTTDLLLGWIIGRLFWLCREGRPFCGRWVRFSAFLLRVLWLVRFSYLWVRARSVEFGFSCEGGRSFCWELSFLCLFLVQSVLPFKFWFTVCRKSFVWSLIIRSAVLFFW